MESDSSSPSTIKRRIRSYPYARSDSEYNELDFATANDVFPVRVPLERVEIGSWTYIATQLEDIELLYELESSDLLIRTDVRGTNGGVPAMFRISTVSATDLSIVTVVPGSLESMVTRLVLETDDVITYQTPDTKTSDEDENALECHIVKMTASVHESGHMRDILLFLKSDHSPELDPDSIFVNPRQTQKPNLETSKSQLTFIEGLPYWVQFIPWQIYSKKIRVFLQWLIVLYSVVSVIWALWQLYKHVEVIRFVFVPIIDVMEYYLSTITDYVDHLLALFTVWWQTFLSPLNIIRSLLMTPFLSVLLQLRTVFYPLFNAVFQCFNNSALRSLLSVLYQLVYLFSYTLWMILKVITKPLNFVWHGILNSRVAVASMDLHRMRISWIFSLVLSNFRSIGRGLAKLVGYTQKEHKRRKAIQKSVASPVISPMHSTVRMRKMPMYYSSPITKQN